jgi:uncharacterized protein (UPF0179 family)
MPVEKASNKAKNLEVT